MIYYTADLHFLYEPLLSSRPFATVEEMDETLIQNWNKTVSPDDTVYLAGDIGYNEGQVPHHLLSRRSRCRAACGHAWTRRGECSWRRDEPARR